jgi:hypothetical protein
MIDPDTLPSPTDSAGCHADFLELSALRSPTAGVSIYSLIRDLRLASANEVVADSEESDQQDESDDQSEPIAEAAFAEFDDRGRSCGADPGHYPFEVSINAIRLRDDADQSLYTFLALLSWFGKDAGPDRADGEKLFEEICAKATETYLGSPHSHVKSFVFGFPRRLQPSGFAAALDKLCHELGEGQGHRRGRPTLPNQKDGKLDIVAWRAFEDHREGKIIAFGQCATGKNWEAKITELPQPHTWCAHWMMDSPVVEPIRSFFVPHRIDHTEWSLKCRLGGILYDRCRIASLASGLVDASLEAEWTAWSRHVLQEIRST